MAQESIRIIEAEERNLQKLSCAIPLKKLVLVTGPSGAGKSTLIFDTLFQEARRRLLSPLSPQELLQAPNFYAPRVKAIEGLPFVMALRPAPYEHPTGTVGTLSEIYHYLTLFFWQLATPYCPNCQRELIGQSRYEMLATLRTELAGEQIIVMAPYGRLGKESRQEILAALLQDGFSRVRIDGEIRHLEQNLLAQPGESASVELLVDSFLLGAESEQRLLEAIELALAKSGGDLLIRLDAADGVEPREFFFSETLRCPSCDRRQGLAELADFHFYQRQGACTACGGSGLEGQRELRGRGKQERAYQTKTPCPLCNGSRLRREILCYRLAEHSLEELLCGPIEALVPWLESWGIIFNQPQNNPIKHLGANTWALLEKSFKEFQARLNALCEQGIAYLEVFRSVFSLSSGEFQRIRLATQLSAAIEGALYLFDELSSGLHPRDLAGVSASLQALAKQGNTVLLIDHDAEFIKASDHLLELGPGGGALGGQLTFSGSVEELKQADTVTARMLKGYGGKGEGKTIPRRPKGWLELSELTLNNLKKLNIRFPLGLLVGVCGVSGSGKSTLVSYALSTAVRQALQEKKKNTEVEKITLSLAKDSPVARLSGFSSIQGLVNYVFRLGAANRRSTVATASSLLKPIRQLFAMTVEARIRGLSEAAFSFNSRAGFCPRCRGIGLEGFQEPENIDILTVCKLCGGTRLAERSRAVRYRGLSISELLELTVSQCAETFNAHPEIRCICDALEELGLGYLRLCQETASLSLGERQRLSLVSRISHRSRGNCLFIFDEVSQGLHPEELYGVIKLFRNLVEQGNTVIVVEHNIFFLRECDYLIELGPGAAARGGRVIGAGTVAELRDNSALIGPYL